LARLVGHAEGMWGRTLLNAVSEFCAEGAPGYICTPFNSVVPCSAPVTFFVDISWWFVEPGVIDGGKMFFYVSQL
jgi:hypothetical protein